jgi:predicted Holliday junction resolvase-like endonuclease
VTEHLIPFFPGFRYNSKDARFLGTPVDIVVFDGLSEGRLRQIVFIEVKTGNNANLSTRERQIRQCVRNRRVAYKLIHHQHGLD